MQRREIQDDPQVKHDSLMIDRYHMIRLWGQESPGE